jgi:hypothetical protein
MSAIKVALMVILVAVLIVYMVRWLGLDAAARERFASAKAHAVYNQSKDLFARNGRATYSEYKATIDGADPVLYTDVRNHWKKGTLTPESVQGAL